MIRKSCPPAYVCNDCTHPVVPIRELQETLFGRSAEDMHDERVWRRYVNESAPMKPDQFRQIIAHAWMQGWLGLGRPKRFGLR